MSRDPLMTWEQPYALDDDGVWCIADESYLLATWGPRCDSSARTIHVTTGEPAPAAIFVTSRNAATLIGEEWSWCLRQALELGITIVRRGKKRLIPTSEFVSALAAKPTNGAAHDEIDAAESIRRALGVKRAHA